METDGEIVVESRTEKPGPAFKYHEIFVRAWSTMRSNWNLFFLFVLVEFASSCSFWLPFKLIEGGTEFGMWTGISLYVLLYGATAFLFVGFLRVLLDYTRLGEVSYARFVTSWKTILRSIVVAVLFISICYLGATCCCIVPGLILATIYSQCYLLVVDERSKVFASFKHSRNMVRGSGHQVFSVLVIECAMLAIPAALFMYLIPALFFDAPVLSGTWTSLWSDDARLYLPSLLVQCIVGTVAFYVNVEMYYALLVPYLTRQEEEKKKAQEQQQIEATEEVQAAQEIEAVEESNAMEESDAVEEPEDEYDDDDL